MHRFLPFRQLTESEVVDLISQLDELKSHELTSLCSDSDCAVTITFQPSADDLCYQIKSKDNNVGLANVRVEVHNKRNGGNPKVRIATNDEETFLALVTVTSSDEGRIVRCACCLSESEGWIPVSRQKTTIAVTALPFTVEVAARELMRHREEVTSAKVLVPITDVGG
ncbi:hypothetical protein AAVH_27003 [Aphelenchoides avenae]|nr:hypothetical protein AAVH_27003 [Aphelenchus avenae]